MLETCCDILVDAYKRNWITSRDWPSAANFAMLATVWFLGIVQYYKG